MTTKIQEMYAKLMKENEELGAINYSREPYFSHEDIIDALEVQEAELRGEFDELINTIGKNHAVGLHSARVGYKTAEFLLNEIRSCPNCELCLEHSKDGRTHDGLS